MLRCCRRLFLFLVCVQTSPLALAQLQELTVDASLAVSPAIALKAIGVLERDPFAPDIETAALLVAKFAEDNRSVEVHISENTLPWLVSDPDNRHAKLLLVAYIAGNIRSQIQNSRTRNDPYAGILFMLDTYTKLRQREPDFKVADLERLSALRAQGTLRRNLLVATGDAHFLPDGPQTWTDPDTGWTFPAQLGAFQKAGGLVYDTPELGYSVAYADTNGRRLDLFVYTLAPSRTPDEAGLDQHFAACIADVREMERLGFYRDLRIVSPQETLIGRLPWRQAALHYSQTREGAHTDLASWLCLTASRQFFVKVRLSTTAEEAESTASALPLLLQEISAIVR